MAKKKKSEEELSPAMQTEDLTGAFPPGDFTGSFPTEGLGHPVGATGEHGLRTEGHSGDLGMPTEGFTGEQPIPTEGFTSSYGMPTSSMTGDHGILPTEGFIAHGAPMGGQELDELDDVLVLLPEEDDVRGYTGEVIRTEGMGDPTIQATTGYVPSSESPTGIEDVQLLSQHPDFGLHPVDTLPDAQVLEELPDIEDVEDITSLVEEAVAYDLPPPMADFEDEFGAMPSRSGRRRSGFGAFLRIAAAAALLVTGVLYGPELYDRYLEQGNTALASGSNGGGGTSTGPPVAITDPVTTGPGSGDPGAGVHPVQVQFRDWVDGVLAANFGTNVPSDR